MFGWIARLQNRINLRIKILVATVLVVGIFTGFGFYLILSFHTENELSQVREFNKILLENTYSAIKYPMSVGDAKTVEQQLKDIKANMKGVEVFISDFKQDVAYASEESRVHSSMELYIRGEEARSALANVLATGASPDRSFAEGQGPEASLVTMKPLANEASCHQCHGTTHKTLGAMVVKQPVGSVYAALVLERNRLIQFAAVEIVGIILVLNFLIFQLVTRRIRRLAGKTGLVSNGDVTVEVRDDARDSIGALTRNFNQMIRNLRDRIEFANSLKFGISDPFFMIDCDMKVTYMNQAVRDLIGLGSKDAQGGRSCEEVFRGDACGEDCPARKAMTTGEPTTGQKLKLKHANGRDIHIMASSAALRDSTGKVLGAFEILRDVTREIETEAELRDSHLKEEMEKRSLQERVEELSEILKKVAGGNLTVRARPSGANDAMDQLIRKTNETLDRMEELITQTKRAAMTVVKGIRHVAEENQSFAQRTEQQAASMEEIRATIEELIANIRQNTGNTQRADSLSKEAVSVAQDGGATVIKASEAMMEMAQASRKIVEMMDFINEITFQTNLLSINAAVEAARAGEQGRGFAVVANEVRNLAKKSSEASKDIRSLVREIIERVGSCKSWIGELENGFEKIIQTIKQASEALTEVSLATQESSMGINQIGQGVKEMSDAIEHNASLVDELAEVTDHFSEKAGLLQSMTEKLVISDQINLEDFEPDGFLSSARKQKRAARASFLKSSRGDASDVEDEGLEDDFFESQLEGGMEDF